LVLNDCSFVEDEFEDDEEEEDENKEKLEIKDIFKDLIKELRIHKRFDIEELDIEISK